MFHSLNNKKMKNYRKALIAFALLVTGGVLLSQCKKGDDSVTPITGTPVYGTMAQDTSWTLDQVHCNVNWESPYYDFSNTMLTGRFNQFNFSPKFAFDETDLSKMSIHFWVQLSTFNTGQPGRDGFGKCGPTYLGNMYLDSLKTQIDPLSDTAKFDATSVVRSGTGYVVKGNFTFNRYRAPSGHPDGTPIVKEVTVYLTASGTKDFDSNNDGTNDKYRSGYIATFSFLRSDFIDNASTKAWWQYAPTDPLTLNNKTYGVYSLSVGDQMDLTMNMVFYKNH